MQNRPTLRCTRPTGWTPLSQCKMMTTLQSTNAPVTLHSRLFHFGGKNIRHLLSQRLPRTQCRAVNRSHPRAPSPHTRKPVPINHLHSPRLPPPHSPFPSQVSADPHISEITLHLSFCDLFSLNVASSRSVHAVANSRMPFFFHGEVYLPLCRCAFSIDPPAGRGFLVFKGYTVYTLFIHFFRTNCSSVRFKIVSSTSGINSMILDT